MNKFQVVRARFTAKEDAYIDCSLPRKPSVISSNKHSWMARVKSYQYYRKHPVASAAPEKESPGYGSALEVKP